LDTPRSGWVLGFHVHLGNHTDKFILVADALDQAQAFVAAGSNRRYYPRKDDGIAQRQDGEQFG
jgi:hypothetical protein